MRAPWTSAPIGEARPWDRWDRKALIAATAIAVWVFAVKLKAFLDLCYTSDLFTQTQEARSWLEGRFLYDNYYGRQLGIHTYLLLSALGVLVKPFGAPGLFVAAAASAGASTFLAHRILRLLGVDGRVAFGAGIALVAMPISLWVFGDGMGFHTDLLVPPLGLALFYALLRRRIVGGLVFTLLVCSVKEDAPVVAAVIAAMVLIETWFAERRWHRPALASIAVAVAAFPLLAWIKHIQPHATYELDHYAMLTGATGTTVNGFGSLIAFLLGRVLDWVTFSLRQHWPLWFLASTVGLLIVRPWFAPLGFLTTGVAWIMAGVFKHTNEGLVWSMRAIDAVLFCWCVILLGIPSLLRWAATLDPPRRQRLKIAAAGVLVASLAGQLYFAATGWDPIDLGLFRASPYTAAERKQANELFAIYRREGRPEEPVGSSPSLFRYAHDRNLLWLDHLKGRPRPIWILQDGEWPFTDFGLRAEDYALVGANGRFKLFKRIGS
ncbi:MAG TPA: DUF2079 domain-containing protein [Polyangia bacterium]|nr:DUF2079 domain-containing protein [Polyangia bacterium]